MLAHHPDVNEVLCLEKGAWADQCKFVHMVFEERGFDCVIDLTDGDRSAVISLATGAPIRIGFNAEHRWRGLLYSRVVKPRPVDQHRGVRPLRLESAGPRPQTGHAVGLCLRIGRKMADQWLNEQGFDR